MTSFLDRIVRAARLDSNVYEEVEADPDSFPQAFYVVALSGMATVVGVTGRFKLPDLLSGFAMGILGWAVWSAIAYQVGARLFPEPQTRADWGQLLRTTGFATAPGMLSILGIIPVLAGFATFVASIWMLLSFAVAVRQALDYRSTIRAICVCLVGWLMYAGMLLSVLPSVSVNAFTAGATMSTRSLIVRLEPDNGQPGDVITGYGTSLDATRVEDLSLTNGMTSALVTIVQQDETAIRFRIPAMSDRGVYTVVIYPPGRYAAPLEQAVRLTVR